MYPVLQEGVTLGIFYNYNTKQASYYAENGAGKRIEVGKPIYDALRQADGTHPLNLPNQGKDIIPALVQHELVRTRRFERVKSSCNRFTLFFFNNRLRNPMPRLEKFITRLWRLIIACFFIRFLFIIPKSAEAYAYPLNIISVVIIIPLAYFIHGLGHYLAVLSLGYTVRHAGLAFWGYLPTGTYLRYDEDPDTDHLDRNYLATAGMKMNVLGAAIFYILSAAFPYLYHNLSFGVVANLAMALINLIPVPGFDGYRLMCSYFYVENLEPTIKYYLSDKNNLLTLKQEKGEGYRFLFLLLLAQFAKIFYILFVSLGLVYLVSQLFPF